ncbi:MAG: ribosome maturation factor RimP [Nitrospiraceae bacterium]
MSDARSIAKRVQELVAPILWTLGLDLVEVVCVGQGGGTVIRVFIDKPGGVTLADCEEAHRSLGPALDVADPLSCAYTLEVSSPGLDRPLKRIEDFRRSIGKYVTVKLRIPHQGQWRLVGQVVGVEDGAVSVQQGESEISETVRLDLASIADARLEVKF